MDKLTLEKRHRKGDTFKKGTTKADRIYFDFVVSGQSLGQLFTTPDLDLIGTFGWHEDKEYKNKQINAFLGISKPELETGRTCLYVCPECGDIGCGAITVKIETTAHTVIWRDFGYENNYSEPNLTDYEEIGPFTFDKNEYFKTLESLRLQD